MQTTRETVRLAAVGDLHVTRSAQGVYHPLFMQMSEEADVLLLCGDLTDYGLPEEAQILARELQGVKVPIVGVLGNHDLESGRQAEVSQILRDAGMILLDGETTEIHGVGFAGVKGFAGGFGRHTLGPWGEAVIKAFVQEALAEALKLESALARLRTTQRIAVLHYAPVKETCEGEPLEIFPFLGTSRLEEPLGRYPVSAVFHGHAHRGTPEAHTASGVPVYNVALPLLRKTMQDRPPFRLFELQASGAGAADMGPDAPATPAIAADGGPGGPPGGGGQLPAPAPAASAA